MTPQFEATLKKVRGNISDINSVIASRTILCNELRQQLKKNNEFQAVHFCHDCGKPSIAANMQQVNDNYYCGICYSEL